MKKKYRIISASDVSDLTKKVNTALSEGWECVGNPFIQDQNKQQIWLQAAVK